MDNFKSILLIVFILPVVQLSCTQPGGIEPEYLTCEFKESPAGVNLNPAFGWNLVSVERNQYQTAYQLLIADNQADINKNQGNIFDSGMKKSTHSINIRPKHPALEPGKKYYWKVKVWDKNSLESGWSKPASFITGLFSEPDWKGAEWIGYEDLPDSLLLVPGVHGSGNNLGEIGLKRPVIPMIRTAFEIPQKIESAYLFISGIGHYKTYINGRVISEDFLSPGWTDYRKICLYNTYDISGYLTTGKNAIGVLVGNGFYNINRERYRKLVIAYGMPALMARIKITYTDGSEESIVTGPDWKANPSPVTYSSMYGGEDYDARMEQPGWNSSGFDDRDWEQAISVRDPGGKLVPEVTSTIRVMEIFDPVNIVRLGPDTYLYDFGQNASGIIRISLKGRRGSKVKLVPGELIDENRQVNQRATGRPYYFEYTLDGSRQETWQPLFTYTGSRYVQVTGAIPAGEQNPDTLPEIIDLQFLHTFNSTPGVGKFETSNKLINRINNLILYAIQSNLQSVVTDCPHREKLGWLEQTYLMGGAIHYNFDLYNLYRKQVRDMISAQTEEGLIPGIAPEYVRFDGAFRDSPEWGSAGIILPWLIYKWYGDSTSMAQAWPMMTRYIKYLEGKADGYILSHGLGDWYDLGPQRPGFAQLTPKDLTATATWYYDVLLASEMAGILHYQDEKDSLTELAGEIKAAFNNMFFDREKGVYSTGSQTAMSMPFVMGLVEEEYQSLVLKNLIDSIIKNDKALTAGDVGFHYLVEALMQGGASQLLYEMNNRDDVPGYGYQLKKGATALTESWAALEAVSNNHLMLGHIMQWFYEGLAGIRQAGDGIACQDIIIKPAMVGDLKFVKGQYKSPYGLIKSGWEKQEGKCIMQVEIPVNTSAWIYLPSDDPDRITENGTLIRDMNDVSIIGTEGETTIIETGSGVYRFEISMN
jgi:alpha-L-rhamnosidase